MLDFRAPGVKAWHQSLDENRELHRELHRENREQYGEV